MAQHTYINTPNRAYSDPRGLEEWLSGQGKKGPGKLLDIDLWIPVGENERAE